MKDKPVIHYLPNVGRFIKEGVYIKDEEARQIFDEGSGDWTQKAYQEMSRRVMNPGQK